MLQVAVPYVGGPGRCRVGRAQCVFALRRSFLHTNRIQNNCWTSYAFVPSLLPHLSCGKNEDRTGRGVVLRSIQAAAHQRLIRVLESVARRFSRLLTRPLSRSSS